MILERAEIEKCMADLAKLSWFDPTKTQLKARKIVLNHFGGAVEGTIKAFCEVAEEEWRKAQGMRACR